MIDLARHCFESHRAEYADQYPADIQQLTSITEAHHVGENALATMFLENKYTIAMSSYAFELLVSYLQDSKFMTLLKYMNQHLNVKGRSLLSYARLFFMLIFLRLVLRTRH